MSICPPGQLVGSVPEPCGSIAQILPWTNTNGPLTILQIVRIGAANVAFATVTSKGQTTIPKDVRAAANLKPGDRIHFTVLEDGTIIVRVKNRSIRDISFKPPGGKRVAIAQMTR
jgi:antitoxin PrlF